MMIRRAICGDDDDDDDVVFVGGRVRGEMESRASRSCMYLGPEVEGCVLLLFGMKCCR